mmetsp:Transcript_153969/g.271878  ORF Transcript_153969/g.271878 Transcript_153969/m.271878 type:complete len:309 (+) Transcript_153969:85-1011(+)
MHDALDGPDRGKGREAVPHVVGAFDVENPTLLRSRQGPGGRYEGSPPRRGVMLEKRMLVASPESAGVSHEAQQAAAKEAAAMAKAREAARRPRTDVMAPDKEVSWYYLDNLGQEYGPLESGAMREWLLAGRFPVGGDLLVRLPEWQWHMPLYTIYPNLSIAFVVPPLWPECKPLEEGQGVLPTVPLLTGPLPQGPLPQGPLPQMPKAPDIEVKAQGEDAHSRTPSPPMQGRYREQARGVPFPEQEMHGVPVPLVDDFYGAGTRLHSDEVHRGSGQPHSQAMLGYQGLEAAARAALERTLVVAAQTGWQ